MNGSLALTSAMDFANAQEFDTAYFAYPANLSLTSTSLLKKEMESTVNSARTYKIESMPSNTIYKQLDEVDLVAHPFCSGVSVLKNLSKLLVMGGPCGMRMTLCPGLPTNDLNEVWMMRLLHNSQQKLLTSE